MADGYRKYEAHRYTRSTGSIGKNTLSVVETHSDEFKVVGLASEPGY